MKPYRLLPITFTNNGALETITPVLLSTGNEHILIDCGYPGFLPRLEAAVQKHDVSFQTITKVIVTHHDIDHIGTLASIKRAYPHFEIIATEEEAPYLDGTTTSLRLEQAQASYGQLPEDMKPWADQFIQSLKAIEPVPVDQTISTDERLPWCGGIEIIPTPGHMPHHISIYLPATKTLLAGDAVVIEAGELNIANPQFTMNMEEAIHSVRRLRDLEIDELICYHGGLYQGDVKEALQQLLDQYSK
ncbi:MBL fold metallo-hydrolase [Bacillaceae bacterium SIJ1]|uniref:MBL fold metallo-hydrolase n=1 Tax=Litoribacterium kuwaitense TaxID=1398745 RepID=UPI0013EBEA4C|nr:MBL fold metallo-hydrolase [Litoribacterium kuwaitense]NGP44635.1 MBL fold metallo-hydrolase [Litoribacterium kuwaitense]